ncbi:MAG: hypothetical protein JW860_03130 [Sedimentisphaerales bacterium]|nr:hypothetical protein [Sedimentisphaerales bacterium]
MKSEERHKLKANELKETIEYLKDFFSRHGTLIFSIVIITLVALWGGNWLLKSRNVEKIEQYNDLQLAISQIYSFQQNAAKAARNPSMDSSYSNTPDNIINSLNLLTRDDTTAVGMMALLQQAETIRSQILFSQQLSEDEKAQLCDRAEKIYDHVIMQYPHEVRAVGWAQTGKGIIAEERGQWDQARKIYEDIALNQGEFYAGTIFPVQARKRLEILDELKNPVIFLPVPPEPMITPVFETPESEVSEEGEEISITVQPEYIPSDETNDDTTGKAPLPPSDTPAEIPDESTSN